MKKNMLLAGIFLIAHQYLIGQGLGQWFNQKNTEIQYYLQQIAAYQTYLKWLEKGYQIAKQGLNTIGEIKKGELDLHSFFFGSLRLVKPALHDKIDDIVQCETGMIQQSGRIKSLSRLNAGEKQYSDAVFNNLLQRGLQTLCELTELLSADTFQMTDGERLEEINKRWEEARYQWAFCQYFIGQASVLNAQRIKELDQMNVLNKLY